MCRGEIPFILLIISKLPKTKRDILWLKAKGSMWASAGDNTLAGAGPQCSPPVRLLGKGKLPWSPNASGHFVLIFRRGGKEERGPRKSRPVGAVCSLIRRNHEAELGDLLKTKPALGWISSFCTSVLLQNNRERCGAESQSLSSPSCPASCTYLPPLLYFLQLAKVWKPVSCINIQMWKTLPASSLNFCCCC